MAKKPTKKASKIVLDQNLPQNILPMGERVDANKNIYISQSTYKEIHKFTKNKTTNESGGILVGTVIEEFGKTNVVIYGFVEAKYAEGTPTTLKFTHETWDYVHGEIEKKYENAQIVGWIHTHPDFGIFLSEYDTFIQENFFKEDYQIAYVVDPIQNIEGFYFWINEKIERCKGFYIFDKTGEKIEIEEEKESSNKRSEIKVPETSAGNPLLVWILGGALAVSIIVFAFISVNMLNRMKILENQQENLVESANQSIAYLQQQITILNGDIEELKEQIKELHPEEEPLPEGELDESAVDIDKGDEATASEISENKVDDSPIIDESQGTEPATDNNVSTEDDGE